MSKASPVVQAKDDTVDLPLSVLLFNRAMTQEMSLSDFADKIGIGALSLRQIISGQTQRPRSKTMELLADVLGISVEEARDRLSVHPTSAPPFSEWLQSHTDGSFSRARLTRETRISDGALRNYLSGQTLPDTDQAQRLALALNVPSLDVAKVIVADQTVREGGEVVPPPAAPPAPAPVAGQPPTPKPAPVVMAEPVASFENAPTLESMSATSFVQSSQPPALAPDEDRLLHLWRQMHPQGRRATLIYIAGLLAEG